MKPHKMLLPLLLALFALSALPAQKPGKDQADQMIKDAKEVSDKIPAKDKTAKQAADEVANAIEKAGKDHPKDADKVKEAVEKKLEEIRDRKSKKDAPGGNDPKVKELVKNMLKKFFGDEGETTAGKIKEAADDTELDGNSEDAVRKRIKDAADAAAEKDPHDPKAVKEAVKKQIEDEIKKVDGSNGSKNQSLLDWLKRLRQALKNNNLLVSAVTEPGRAADSPSARFRFGLGGTLPLGSPGPREVRHTSLEQAIYTPGVANQLYERLGGEFLMEGAIKQGIRVYEMEGRARTMPGIQLGLRLGKAFEFRATGHYSQTEWSGTFPVLVFSDQHGTSQQPRTVAGELTASTSGVMAETGLAYSFGQGTLRPFVHAGLRGQFPLRNEFEATLAGVVLPLEAPIAETEISPFGGAGVQLSFLKNGYLEARADYGSLPGGHYAPSVALSVGLQFGMVKKPAEAPELISINDDKCECTSTIVELDADASVTTRPRPNQPIKKEHTFKTADVKSSSFEHEVKVAEGDKVSLLLDQLKVVCQECKLGDCPPSIKKVKIKVAGLEPFPKLDANGKPEMKDGKPVTTNEKTFEAKDGRGNAVTSWEANNIKVLPGNDPARMEITVTYRCGKDIPVKDKDCKQSPDCTNQFVVIFQREK